MKSTYKLTVRGYELDSFGHVNNAVYLQYAEAAKWDFFSKSGTLPLLREEKLFPVILENNIRYMNELQLMEEVLVTTEWECSANIIRFRHIISSLTTGKKSCRITGKLVYVDENRMICTIPEHIIKTMERGSDDISE
ncbi:MAG: acyl-CoA thioesterase [Oscillospiraceae bacterium]|nr:acyl-CoA thioesterase [Oscillospiraceae bacterium]